MKKVVTGVNEHGRSYVVSTDEIDTGSGGLIWEYEPSQIREWIAAIDPAAAADWIGPEVSGGVRWYLAPLQSGETDAPEMQGIDKDGFHTTRTVDFDVILDGEVTMVLDEDRVKLEKGDMVVQQATRHAWKNEGSKPALLLALIHRPVDV